jgi:hypothetical protein
MLTERNHEMALDETVIKATEEFIDKLSGLSHEPYLREGIMKMVVREMTWALNEKLEGGYELADQLEGMAELLREKLHSEGADKAA